MSDIRDLSAADKRINVESRLLEYLSRRGGQRIIAGPAMDALLADLVNETYALAREGFLPAADADLKTLAEGLLDIAEQAMPTSYLGSDSRCQLARSVLDRLGEDEPAGEDTT